MKKLILILGLLSLSTFVFSRPIIQLDVIGPGIFTQTEKNAFNKIDPVSNYTDFEPAFGGNAVLIWEFNSSDESKFHFNTGIETGLNGLWIPFSLSAGFSYKLCDFNWAILELNSTIQGGCAIPLIDYYYFAYVKTTFDVVMMKPDRRGFYGGIGIADFILPDFSFYKDYGINVILLNYAGLHIMGGYRF